MQIRSEHPADVAAIREVTLAAFRDAPFSNQTEADIVEALRSAGVLTVSLVAVLDGEIVGHVAFSPVKIAVGEGRWYGLGPVSVHPDRQGQGMGQALIRAGLGQLESLNAAGCVVLGDPGYYQRFGFTSDPTLSSGLAPSAYFQRLVFQGPPPSGQVLYHPAFET